MSLLEDCYVKKNRSVKLECYDKNIFDKYSDELLESVTRSRSQYIAAMKYLRSLLEKEVDGKDKQEKIVPFSILFHVGAKYHKGMFEVRVDFRDTKFNLTLCELSENCQYGFWGRFLIKGYPCWDLHSETMALYKKLNIDPVEIKKKQEEARKNRPPPTWEDYLPQSLKEKVNIRKFKSLVEERFPPTSPAFRVIIPEKDEMTWVEYTSKIDTWLRVIRISSEH